MADLSQTKTVQGYIPFKGVELRDPQPEQTANDSQLIFDLYGPIELAMHTAATAPQHSERHADLIKLASCVEPTGDLTAPIRVDVDNILGFARESGPLFGQSAIEIARDWAYAACPALIAVRIQEYLNGNCKIAKVQAIHQVEKFVIINETNASRFSMYSLYLGTSGDYTNCLKNLPIVRRIESGEGYFYAFVSVSSDSEGIVEFRVFSFDHEITTADFAVLRMLLDLDQTTADSAQQHLKIAVPAHAIETSCYAIDADASIVPEERPLDNGDKGALTALVQALVITHLSGAHVDVFQGSEATGFLSFDSYLSWLWFDFSRKLGTVKIGYCQQCGRAFSLAGHRGVERKFCSEKCKTDAKNEKTRVETQKIRHLFSAGCSVNEIVKMLDRTVSADYVRRQLSKWTQLKHDLDDDIATSGFDGSSLLKRCGAEGLDLDRLLNSKRKAELKRAVKGLQG